jgi:hypothetical protein
MLRLLAYPLQGAATMTFYPHVVMTIEDLRKVIEDLPDDMGVEVAEGMSIPAKTVRELRALVNFPSGHERLRILVPRPRYRESVVKIELVD